DAEVARREPQKAFGHQPSAQTAKVPGGGRGHQRGPEVLALSEDINSASIEERILRITGYYGYQPWNASYRVSQREGKWRRKGWGEPTEVEKNHRQGVGWTQGDREQESGFRHIKGPIKWSGVCTKSASGM
ncbi:hypothetical protein F7725_024162, partial [Dissostichus mawsoni]